MPEIVKILKCLAGCSNGYVIAVEGIAYEGKLWLVPSWLAISGSKYATPERLIRFDNLHHQAATEPDLDYEGIQLPIPDDALLSPLPQGIEYIDRPNGLYVDSQALAYSRVPKQVH